MNRMTPTLHMSTAGEYSLRPSPMPSTSGATYCGDPHIVDSTVSGEKNFDSPKSAILTGESSRSFIMIMFSSFRSRCTMPVQGWRMEGGMSSVTRFVASGIIMLLSFGSCFVTLIDRVKRRKHQGACSAEHNHASSIKSHCAQRVVQCAGRSDGLPISYSYLLQLSETPPPPPRCLPWA